MARASKTVETKSWFLEDVEAAAAQHPSALRLPPRAERERQQPGAQVQLHFVLADRREEDPRAERMWVEIACVRGGKYVGVLTNTPAAIPGLEAGDRVEFGPEHIACTCAGPGHPDWVDCADKTAIVSAAALASGQCVRWVYRERPHGGDDSGWRLFEGSEPQEYLDDARNARIAGVGWLLERDRSLAEVLRAPPGAAFEREGPAQPWTRVAFEPPDES